MDSPKKTFRLSPSSINLLIECPRCFWLEKHGIWKRPSGIFPSLPSGMDRILKDHFDWFRDQNKLPPEICDKEDCTGMTLFQDKESLKVWQNNFKGISWTDEKGNTLSGAVDNILQKDGKLIVMDYKTRGFELKEDTHKHYQNQLDFYNLLLRKNNYETEDFAFLLFYVPSKVTETGEVIFNTTLLKIPTNAEHAENIFNKAIEILEGECPEQGCEWCDRV